MPRCTRRPPPVRRPQRTPPPPPTSRPLQQPRPPQPTPSLSTSLVTAASPSPPHHLSRPAQPGIFSSRALPNRHQASALNASSTHRPVRHTTCSGRRSRASFAFSIYRPSIFRVPHLSRL